MNSFKRQIYKISQFEENEKNPPTVDDYLEEYTSGVFTFDTSNFTNNFQDLDEDSYKITRLNSLPSVGVIKYNSIPVVKDFMFNLTNVGLLTYELPSNYMISSNGYCEFEEPINTIISTNEQEGYSLSYLGQGRLEFIKNNSEEIPTNTDIYAIFDTSSYTFEEAELSFSKLNDWFTNFKSNKPDFTGNLYILPTTDNRWLLYPSMIKKGIFSSLLTGKWEGISILPPNYIIGDVKANLTNSNWEFNTNSIVLSFVNDASDEYHSSSLLQGFKGTTKQPSRSFINDYGYFLRAYKDFNFFKGVVYPIVDALEGQGGAMVLHTMASIEGSKLSQTKIDSTGTKVYVSVLKETNPYEGFSTFTTELEPLENFGWTAIYNKQYPIMDVFNSDSFSEELTSYIVGNTNLNNETKIVKGECNEGGDICFYFRTSDDSDYTLFSNIATFCFTGVDSPENIQEENAPTVDSVHRAYDKGLYTFSLSDFTNNFYDKDGDSYEDIRLESKIISSSNIEIEGLKLSGTDFTIPQIIDTTEVTNLTFDIPNYYVPITGNLVKFDSELSTLITNIENQGYSLLNNINGNLEFYKLNISNPESPTVEINTIKGKNIGNLSICLNFKINDNSPYNLFSNPAQVCLDLQDGNSAPTVSDSDDIMTSNEFTFNSGHFTNNFSDSEGDTAKTVRIESKIEGTLGKFTFKGYELETPFSFNLSEVGQLKYTLEDRFSFEGTEIYSFNSTINDIISEQNSLGYSLTSNNEGILTFEKTIEGEVQYKYIPGNTVTTKEYCFDFRTSDNNEVPLFSNVAKVCLTIPESETEIEFNHPPTVGDNEIVIE